ncbi:amidohydrolase family protein [Enterococcus faecalis]|uniref:amidohydrolase family protein n=1 Tax=Enterococcus faecalis TaxID=1351 RepID=UPI001F5835B4|nr:amidohydrolase family protein [Enterococcus faecalis]
MVKIDVFAHVLLPQFKEWMLQLDKQLPKKLPFIQHIHLTDMKTRQMYHVEGTKQIISYVNTNPEDYLGENEAAIFVRKANQELIETVQQYPSMFAGGVAMLPLNNISESLKIIEDTVLANTEILGIQLFTRHLGKSIASKEFYAIFRACAESNVPIWLHPIFDVRKPDNNILFSWEYEQTQAMLQIVQAGIYQDFPNLKIIVHHAGAMVPYFAGRIEHILPKTQVADFKKFYVDTALLGNTKALELAVDYFGIDRVLFGTDAPLGISPAGATREIIHAIEEMALTEIEKQAIFEKNAQKILLLNE